MKKLFTILTILIIPTVAYSEPVWFKKVEVVIECDATCICSEGQEQYTDETLPGLFFKILVENPGWQIMQFGVAYSEKKKKICWKYEPVPPDNYAIKTVYIECSEIDSHLMRWEYCPSAIQTISFWLQFGGRYGK